MLLSDKRWRLLLLLLLSSNFIFSQEVSPYSRFGLGKVVTPAFAASKGMGRLASAYRDPLNINFSNPASYSNLALTTLEAGFNFSAKKITDGQTLRSYRTGEAFFDYLALGFPAGKGVCTSFGIVPYSEMNYNFQESGIDTINGNSRRIFEGTGRTYQLYTGAAYRYPASDTSGSVFSVGLNFAYLFGSLERKEILRFSEAGYYNIYTASAARLSNFALNAGVQFRKNLNDSLSTVIGAFGFFPLANSSSVHVIRSRMAVLSTAATVPVDTLYESDGKNDRLKIPVDIGWGAGIGNLNKWMAGVEIKYSLWNDVEAFSEEAQLKNSVEVRAGGEFRPNYTSQNLFKSSTYRLGAFYSSGYLHVDGQRIMTYGFTWGWGVPIKTLYSRLNFSFEVGSQGTTKSGLISEAFFRTYIGLVLNDRWFIRPKYD